jgi:hypothetical protein
MPSSYQSQAHIELDEALGALSQIPEDPAVVLDAALHRAEVYAMLSVAVAIEQLSEVMKLK